MRDCDASYTGHLRGTRALTPGPFPAAARLESLQDVRLFASMVLLGLLGTAPVFAHHLEHSAGVVAGSTHLGEVCLVALHQLLTPVHSLFHLTIVAGLLYAAWDRFRSVRRSRGVLQQLGGELPIADSAVWVAAGRVGLDPMRLRVVASLPNPAFTVGWLRPVVYLSGDLLRRLSPEQLEAVLAHERVHVMRRDPLRLSAVRFLTCVLFWIPAFRRLAEDLVDATEMRADEIATRSAGGAHPLALASALLAVASWTSANLRGSPGLAVLPVPAEAVGFSGRDLLESRVRRLAGESTRVRSHVTRRSLLAAALALGLVWTSGFMVVHPLAAQRPTASVIHSGSADWRAGSSADRSTMNCTRHGGSALLHIFCPEHAVECPH